MLQKLANNTDVIYKKTEVNCTLCYQEQMCNMIEFMKDFYPYIKQHQEADLNDLFPGICKEVEDDFDQLQQYLFSGLMLAQRNKKIYVFDLSKAPTRTTSDSIAEPDNIFGSRDGFVENFKDNIALIRTRVKEANLKIDSLNIGRRSKTIVSVLSIEDIHNQDHRKILLEELGKIDIDAILSIEDLMAYFQKDNLFAAYHYIGTPDTACRRLYNGEFLIIIDRICCVISLPTTLAYTSRLKIDGLNIPIYSFIERSFVLGATFLAIFFCAILASFTSFQRDSLSFTIISTLKVSQADIYLPIYIEILLVLAMFELYYLIGFRQPKATVSSTIVLIGGLIIGQNLISSGLAGVFIMTATALCFLTTFVVSSNVTTILAISVIRVMLLFCSLFYGLVGVIIGSILLAFHLQKQKTLEVPYFYPFIPFDVRGIHKFFMSSSSVQNNHRDEPLDVQNRHRRKMHD